jgi:hypothetical protein
MQTSITDPEKRDIQFEVSQYLNSPLFSLKDGPFMIWDQIKLTYP